MGGFDGNIIANPDAAEDAPMSDIMYALQRVPNLSSGYVMVAR